MTRAADDARPDPDALLERVRAETEIRRTKLRIWFGASPGVGKTFSMLENAQQLRRAGVDIVVGLVESHGRAETAELLRDLPQVARAQIPYRGRTLEEFDLDATLARKPKVVLLDELAHTNAPGSRHPKRWQDALELLAAGIEVHTTLNVQHVESLNDVIAQITQVRVRETVPDEIVERADEIELVDVPPEVVLERLREGKVYVPDQAARAAAGFFREGNLHALRELALRLTAERVDAEVQTWRRLQGIETTWPTRERIMVCIGPSPASARLVRATRRMASAVRAPWLAAYVERPGATLREADRTRLNAHMRLAEALGGEVVVLAGERPAEPLLALARQRNVTRIVAGKPTHPRWRDLIYGSLLDDLVRGSGDIDVHVIAGTTPHESGPAPREPHPSPPVPYASYAIGLVPVLLATAVAFFVREVLDVADVAMIFLVAIAATATFRGRGPSMLASVLSVAIFDFCFIPPYFTFAVGDFRHVLTFVVMLCAGLLISTLTERIRRQSSGARERERHTAALYGLSRALAGARDVPAIAAVAQVQLHDVFDASAVLFVRDPSTTSGLSTPSPVTVELTEPDRTVARWALEHAKPAGRGEETLPGARVVALPLLAEGRAVGVLVLSRDGEPFSSEPAQRHLLETFLAQIALAIERAQLAGDAQRSQLRAETEEMRSSLLSSVSHDLRTPIGSVLGAATALLDSGTRLPEEDRAELIGTIRDEAARLARLVGNLLDMTRVESGSLELRREWAPVEEIVANAMSRVESRLEGRSVTIRVPDDALVEGDPSLLEQALINLLENAAKHTPAGTPIDVRATRERDSVSIEVADRGQGLPPGSEARIFEKFVRVGGAGGGVGLGLAICKGIVQAHGGSIVASTRADGGASFRMTIPIGSEPPVLPIEPMEDDA